MSYIYMEFTEAPGTGNTRVNTHTLVRDFDLKYPTEHNLIALHLTSLVLFTRYVPGTTTIKYTFPRVTTQ